MLDFAGDGSYFRRPDGPDRSFDLGGRGHDKLRHRRSARVLPDDAV
jgi:hypothetical protein